MTGFVVIVMNLFAYSIHNQNFMEEEFDQRKELDVLSDSFFLIYVDTVNYFTIFAG